MQKRNLQHQCPVITLPHLLRPRTHHKLHAVERAVCASATTFIVWKSAATPHARPPPERAQALHAHPHAHTHTHTLTSIPHSIISASVWCGAHFVATILAVNDPASVVATVTAPPAASEAAVATDDLQLHHSAELACLLLQAEETQQNNGTLADGCPVFFDSVLCWPRTAPDTLATQPCFDEFNGVQYDQSNNATRFCHASGSWDNHTNYDQCQHILSKDDIAENVHEFKPHIEVSTYIYAGGYLLSLAALIAALVVFLNFKELKCLRNKIHGNLFVTYILSVSLWMLTLTLQITGNSDVTGCIFLVILYHYFSLTNFCWMLVEGLYLYMLVVQTFTGDNLNFRIYAFIGWGCPAILTAIWAITKSIILHNDAETSVQSSGLECAWMRESVIDWICQAPAIVCLIVNFVFLLRIMWVLITKLRSANTVETQQYRKASKALLVLIPLLGITYLVMLAGPNDGGIGNHIFTFVRALLLSTQGFAVAMLYCFLNSEVRTALRHRIERWREERNLQAGRSSNSKSRSYGMAQDSSPRSRTESIRLTSSCYTPT